MSILCWSIAGLAAHAAEPVVQEDPGREALAAYLDGRFEKALELWRPIVEGGEPGGVLLYRWAYSLNAIRAPEGEVEKARARAMKALRKAVEGGGTPMDCYYLSVYLDDEEAMPLRKQCFARYREFPPDATPADLYFIARLVTGTDEAGSEKESILREALERSQRDDAAPDPWIREVYKGLADLLVDTDRPDEAVDLLSAALESDPDSCALLTERGFVQWRQDRHEQAQSDLRACVSMRPDYGEAWTYLGLSLADEGKLEEAEAAYRKALDAGYRSATVYNGLGRCLADRGERDAAIEALESAVKESADWFPPRVALARAYLAANRLEEAERQARQVIRLQHGSRTGHVILAEIKEKAGDIEAANDAYRAAVAANPADDVAHAELGEFLLEQGRAGEALPSFLKAVEIDPNYAPWHRNLGSAQESLKRFDEAERSYSKSVELDPNDASNFGYLASLYETLERYDEALSMYDRAEKLSPNYAYAVEHHARILEKLHGAESVVEYLGPRVERFPDNPYILRLTGIAYHTSGSLEEAERILRKLVEVSPAYDLGYDSLALVRNEIAGIDAALDTLRKGLVQVPDSSTLNFRFGVFLEMTGHAEEAEAPLRRALEIDPSNATAWNSLGVVFQRLHREEEALDAFAKATELREGFHLAQMNSARLLRSLDRTDEAIEAFTKVIEIDPADAEARALLGEQLQLRARHEQSLAVTEPCLSLEPPHPGCHNVRADALIALGRTEEGIAAYRRAQEVATDNEYPYRREAEVRHSSKDYAKELEVIGRWRERFPQSLAALQRECVAFLYLGRYDDARTAAELALKTSANDATSQTCLADTYTNEDRFEEAAEHYAKALESDPNLPLVHAALGRTLARLGRMADATESFRRSVILDAGDSTIRLQLVGHLRKTGEDREAENLLTGRISSLEKQISRRNAAGGSSSAARDPSAEIESLSLALADLYLSTGRPKKALRYLRAVSERAPGDLAPIKSLAEALRETGDATGAKEAIVGGLALDPSDEELVGLLRSLHLAEGEVEEILRGLRPVALGFDSAPTGALLGNFMERPEQIAGLLAGQSFAVVQDHLQVRVNEGGLLTETHHQLLAPLNDGGVSALGEYRIYWTPNLEELEVHAARTHLPDGRVVDAPESAYHLLSPADTETANIYSEQKVKVISLPEVRPGAVIEIKYTTRMKSTLEGRAWWLSFGFGAFGPSLYSRIALSVPEGVSFRHAVLGPAVETEMKQDGDRRIYTWSARERPAFPNEPNGPPLNDLRSVVVVSSYESWDELAGWIAGLMTNRFDLGSEERRRMNALVEGIEAPLEKVRALYYEIQKTVRYVSVAYGIGSHQPRPASETLKSAYGDCKDRAVLLISMLDAVGIRALPTLVRSRKLGKLVPEVPSPGQFDHMIVYVPSINAASGEDGEKGLFIDPTTRYYDLGVLPPEVQGLDAFVVEGGKGRFIRTPVNSSALNSHRFLRRFEIQPAGGALVTENNLYTGQPAAFLREVVSSYDAAVFKDLLNQSMEKVFPGIEDLEYELEGVAAADAAVHDQESYRIPEFVKQVDASWFISFPMLDDVANALPLSAGAARRSDYRAMTTLDFYETAEVLLPEGWVFESWPEAIRIESEDAMMSLDVVTDPPADQSRRESNAAVTSLRIQARFILENRDIPVSRYAEFASVVTRAGSSGKISLLARRR